MAHGRRRRHPKKGYTTYVRYLSFILDCVDDYWVLGLSLMTVTWLTQIPAFPDEEARNLARMARKATRFRKKVRRGVISLGKVEGAPGFWGFDVRCPLLMPSLQATRSANRRRSTRTLAAWKTGFRK